MQVMLAALWKRRWCRILLWIALIFGFACLHPFVRQSFFGPTIDGIPWCVWEHRVRADANVGEPRTALVEFLERIGLLPTHSAEVVLDSPSALPLFLTLVEDADPRVRERSLQQLSRRVVADEAAVLPVLRQHLTDEDARCRLFAMRGLWRANKDARLWPIAAALVGNAQPEAHHGGFQLLCEMAKLDADAFARLAKLAEEGDETALRAMQQFGKRSVPVLRRALQDERSRGTALGAVIAMKKDAAELLPNLLAIQKDGSEYDRAYVAAALFAVDPEHFPSVTLPGGRGMIAPGGTGRAKVVTPTEEEK